MTTTETVWQVQERAANGNWYAASREMAERDKAVSWLAQMRADYDRLTEGFRLVKRTTTTVVEEEAP